MDYNQFEITYKEVLKTLRQAIISNAVRGGYTQRCRLLALGFLRGRKYETIEAKTNADKHCALGQKTFYSDLAFNVAGIILSHYTKTDSFHSSSHPAFVPLHKEIHDWMKERYLSQNAEAAE